MKRNDTDMVAISDREEVGCDYFDWYHTVWICLRPVSWPETITYAKVQTHVVVNYRSVDVAVYGELRAMFV